MNDDRAQNLSGRIRGFTLIETLIAMIVMSVGMLGIAGLYLQTLQAGRTSQFRTQAVNLASDVAERIRANRTAGITYAGTGADHGCDTAPVNCSAEQMAQHDIFRWSEQAQRILPDGEVDVTLDQGTLPWTYTVSVLWDEAGQPDPPSYTIQVQAMN